MIITDKRYQELLEAEKTVNGFETFWQELQAYLLSPKFKEDNRVNVNDILMRMQEVNRF